MEDFESKWLWNDNVLLITSNIFANIIMCQQWWNTISEFIQYVLTLFRCIDMATCGHWMPNRIKNGEFWIKINMKLNQNSAMKWSFLLITSMIWTNIMCRNGESNFWIHTVCFTSIYGVSTWQNVDIKCPIE